MLVAGTCLVSCGGEVTGSGDPGNGSAAPRVSADPSTSSNAPIRTSSSGVGGRSTSCTAFVTTTPSDNKTKVGVFDDVTLEFCSALDPSSVTSLHVELLAPHATVGRKAVVVSYDASKRRVVLHPTLPMTSDATYRVRARGLKTADGGVVDDIALSFHTVRDPLVHSYGPIGGAPQSQVGTLDAEGRVSRMEVFTPGPDGVPGNADDVDTLYGYAYSYSSSSSSTSYTQVLSAAGPDGTFGTSDDIVYDAVGREDSELAPYSAWTARSMGPDGKLGTADDGYINCGRQYYTDDGRPSHMEWFKDAGADGIPFTADDTIMNYTVFDDSTPGHPQVAYYTKPGPDGQWHTADDVMSGAIVETTDDIGRSLLEVHRSLGPDGIWGTADDVTTEVHAYGYDSRGIETSHRAYYNPGPDKTWLTSDDSLWFMGSYGSDLEGNVTSLDMSGVHYVFAPQL